jgi:cytidine deaminase
LTVCAERAAVSAAIGAGHRRIAAVAVSAPQRSGTTPCGACRQFLSEFRPADSDMVIVVDDGHAGELVRLEELLPHAFGPRNLDSGPPTADARSATPRGDHGG